MKYVTDHLHLSNGEKMHAKIEIEIIEEKDGSLLLKMNGKGIGNIDHVNPLSELETIQLMAELIDKIKEQDELHKELLDDIQQRLAKLLAWYHTEP